MSSTVKPPVAVKLALTRERLKRLADGKASYAPLADARGYRTVCRPVKMAPVPGGLSLRPARDVPMPGLSNWLAMTWSRLRCHV